MADHGKNREPRNVQTIILEKGETGYGFNIRGGTDNCHVGDDPGIFVTSMRPDGAAAKDGRLKKGDRIISVNGQNISNVNHEVAVTVFRNASEKVVLVVESGAEMKLKRQLLDQAALTSSSRTQAAAGGRGQNAAARETPRRNLDSSMDLPVSKYAKIVLFVAGTMVVTYLAYKKFDSIKCACKRLLGWH